MNQWAASEPAGAATVCVVANVRVERDELLRLLADVPGIDVLAAVEISQAPETFASTRGVRAAADESARAVLTTREHEIFGLIADGLTNKQVASRLHIELSTVKNHVHNILGKLKLRSRTEIREQARPADDLDRT